MFSYSRDDFIHLTKNMADLQRIKVDFGLINGSHSNTKICDKPRGLEAGILSRTLGKSKSQVYRLQLKTLYVLIGTVLVLLIIYKGFQFFFKHSEVKKGLWNLFLLVVVGLETWLDLIFEVQYLCDGLIIDPDFETVQKKRAIMDKADGIIFLVQVVLAQLFSIIWVRLVVLPDDV